MLAFRCITSACEDHCCGGWSVSVDRAAYDKLAARLTKGAPSEREQIFSHIRVRENDPDPERYAQLVMGSDGDCALLEPSGRCSIHARYGEEHLANTCSTYPRFVSRVGDSIEMHGMTSCPEVARLALLGDDTTGLDLQDATGRDDVFVRDVVDRTVVATDDAHASFALVRSTLQALLRLDEYPIATRLFFVGFFADRSRSFLHDGADMVPAALGALIGTMQSPSVLNQLHRQVSQAATNAPFATSIVQRFLTRAPALHPRGMRELLAAIRPRPQRPRLDAATEARLAFYVERFALDHVTRGSHVALPSLVQYAIGLFARVATLRFLFASHPLVHTSSPPLADLDGLYIRIVYSMARTIDHCVDFTRDLLGGLDAQGQTRLEHMVALIKL